MVSLFRNPTFTKLFIASFASQLGSVVDNMAFAFYLVGRFSSRPSLPTTAELMYSLPTIAVFWIVGVIADRFDRKIIATYSDWIRASLTLLLLLFVHYDELAACFLVLFLRSAVSRFFSPSEMGLLQETISKEQYVQAAGLNQIVMGLFMLFGLSLGATAYHFIGVQGAIIMDCLSFLLSGILLSLGKFPESARIPNGKSKIQNLRGTQVLKDFWHGLRYIIDSPLLLVLIPGFLFFGIVNGVFAVLPIFAMKYKLSPHHYVVDSSLITICLGAGFLIGSVAGPWLIRRFTRTWIIIGGLFVSSMLIAALGYTDRVAVYLSLVLIEGIAIAPVNIALGSWMPELVRIQNTGRVNALIEPIMMLGQSLALGFVALAFPHWVSITWLHYVLAVCTVFVSTYYLIALPRMVRRRSDQEGALSGTVEENATTL